MSPEFSINDYLNEQFPIPDAISTESLQALLNKKTEEYEYLQTQVFILINISFWIYQEFNFLTRFLYCSFYYYY